MPHENDTSIDALGFKHRDHRKLDPATRIHQRTRAKQRSTAPSPSGRQLHQLLQVDKQLLPDEQLLLLLCQRACLACRRARPRPSSLLGPAAPLAHPTIIRCASPLIQTLRHDRRPSTESHKIAANPWNRGRGLRNTHGRARGGCCCCSHSGWRRRDQGKLGRPDEALREGHGAVPHLRVARHREARYEHGWPCCPLTGQALQTATAFPSSRLD
jgi:hypothetical protein